MVKKVTVFHLIFHCSPLGEPFKLGFLIAKKKDNEVAHTLFQSKIETKCVPATAAAAECIHCKRNA